jgi:hypothetical protein
MGTFAALPDNRRYFIQRRAGYLGEAERWEHIAEAENSALFKH